MMSSPTELAGRTQRPRRTIAAWQLTLLKPVLRYSTSRDAWVLRGIGNTRGPVFVTNR